MRLSTSQIVAIKQEAGYCSGIGAQVWLFGLRLDDKQRGFTLVELIMVMVIVGILAAVVAPRFFDNNVFQERGAADQIRAALRYGQKVAIAQRGSVTVNISTGSASDCGVALVGGNINCVISNSVLAPAYTKSVGFNALGQPVPNAADSIAVGTIVVTIEAETGYVH
jgi:MSHA pilin protein MshC